MIRAFGALMLVALMIGALSMRSGVANNARCWSEWPHAQARSLGRDDTRPRHLRVEFSLAGVQVQGHDISYSDSSVAWPARDQPVLVAYDPANPRRIIPEVSPRTLPKQSLFNLGAFTAIALFLLFGARILARDRKTANVEPDTR